MSSFLSNTRASSRVKSEVKAASLKAGWPIYGFSGGSSDGPPPVCPGGGSTGSVVVVVTGSSVSSMFSFSFGSLLITSSASNTKLQRDTNLVCDPLNPADLPLLGTSDIKLFLAHLYLPEKVLIPCQRRLNVAVFHSFR